MEVRKIKSNRSSIDEKGNLSTGRQSAKVSMESIDIHGDVSTREINRNVPIQGEVDVHHGFEINDGEHEVKSNRSRSDKGRNEFTGRESAPVSEERLNTYKDIQEVNRNINEEDADVYYQSEITSDRSSSDDEEVNECTRTPFATVSMEQVNIHEGCEGAQVGNRNVYHGEVDVHHVLEINNAENLPAPVFPNSAEIPNFHQLNTPNIGNEGFQNYSVDPDTDRIVPLLQEKGYDPSRTSECEPLINKKEVTGGFKSEYFAIIILVLVSLITAVILTITFGRIPSIDNLPVSFTHIYRTRIKWFAVSPKYYIPAFKYKPPKFVVVSQTGTPPCYLPSSCNTAVKNIQSAEMASVYADIACNFLVAGDGLIYEGRGWNTRSASVPGMECSALVVEFIGNFTTDLPPQYQIDAFRVLLDTGEIYGGLEPGYKMFMKSEIIRGIEDPGKNLTEFLKQWSHWTPFGPEYFICSK